MAAAAVSTIQVKIPDAGDLCKLNISDAWHDFKPDVVNSEVYNMMPGSNTCEHMNENTLASTMLNLTRETRTSEFKFGNDTGQDAHPYMKNYTIKQYSNWQALANLFYYRYKL